MDNTRDIPGYKYFVDATTGDRPRVYVAFLDLEPDPHTTVNGVVFPVTDQELAALDARERNYERRRIDDFWVYFGTEAAKRRRHAGTAVISREYLDLVQAGFARLGQTQLAKFDASTEDPPLPIRPLRRVDIPPNGR